jgi:hypothetical protein
MLSKILTSELGGNRRFCAAPNSKTLFAGRPLIGNQCSRQKVSEKCTAWFLLSSYFILHLPQGRAAYSHPVKWFPHPIEELTPAWFLSMTEPLLERAGIVLPIANQSSLKYYIKFSAPEAGIARTGCSMHTESVRLQPRIRICPENDFPTLDVARMRCILSKKQGRW